MGPDSSKSSKSVTFTATDGENPEIDLTGMLIESPSPEEMEHEYHSISTRLPWSTRGPQHAGQGSHDDLDLWLAFLTETGIMQASEIAHAPSEQCRAGSIDHGGTKIDDPDSMIREMNFYNQTPCETISTTIRDDYEGIHLLCPGLFWDTVTMDDREAAFIKTKKLIRDIVNSQKYLTPMFDIDFTNLEDYPTVEKRLANIREQIASQRLFH